MAKISKREMNYRIDFTKMTLIMTADFADQAYIEDTEEYKILTRLKKDFPDLKIERKTHRTPAKYKTKSGEEYTHNQFKDLTYKRMEKFLSRIPNGAAYQKEYHHIIPMFREVGKVKICQQFPQFFICQIHLRFSVGS